MEILKKVRSLSNKQHMLIRMDDGSLQWLKALPGSTEEGIMATALGIQTVREAEKAEALGLKQLAEEEALLFEEYKKQK